MRKRRTGSLFVTGTGTPVFRRPQLWAFPPETAPEKKAGIKRGQLDRAAGRRQHFQEVVANLLRPNADDLYFHASGHDVLETFGVAPLHDNFNAFMSHYDQMKIELPEDGFVSKLKMRGAQASLYAKFRPTRELPSNDRKAFQRVDLVTLLRDRHRLALRMLDQCHALTADANDTDAFLGLMATKSAFGYINAELQRRAAFGDSESLGFLRNLKQDRWDLAHEEKEKFGFNLLKPDNEMTFTETLQYVGCTEDEFLVYVWADVIEPAGARWSPRHPGRSVTPNASGAPQPSGAPQGMRFFGADVMALKADYNKHT
jgi:hypothetical protein